ncbi:MAG: SPFH domain-containing protein [Elusimicrobiaceae bacterium]
MAILDVVKYDGPNDILVWKWPGDQLSWGSQLIVNQSQEALFYRNGQALDLVGPGRHSLSTANIPLLESIVNIPFGNNTPFPAEVYFINKAVLLDVKWGTPRPMPILDPQLNIFLPIRANGQFGFRVKDSRKMVVQLVGTVPTFSKEDVSDYFKGVILTKAKDYIASQLIERKLSILTVSAHLAEMSQSLQAKLQADFELFGLDIVNFFINAIDVPDDDPEVKHIKQAMASKAEFSIMGEDVYRMKRTFDVLEASAKNEGAGNLMGAGMGLGMGMGAGSAFASVTGGMMAAVQPAPKVPAPPSAMVACPACGNKAFSAYKFCTVCGGPMITANAVCPSCAVEVPVGAKFCGHCGRKLAVSLCPKCGVEVPPVASFCPHCKNKLDNRS